MSVSGSLAIADSDRRTYRIRALIMVFGCTVCGAAAQILIKGGLVQMPHVTVPAILANFKLLAGLVLYGMSTGLLIAALRYGELSILYPVIALTYVWVSLLSMWLFKETMNPFKVVGLTTIVFGVTLLGADRKQK